MRTIVKLILDKRSNYFLNEKFDLNKKEFHTTVYYAEETPLFERNYIREEIKSFLPILINQSTYHFDFFGKKNNELVLKYEDSKIKKIYNKLRMYAFKQMITEWPDLEEIEMQILKQHHRRKSPIYSEFNPHITLVKNFEKGNFENLSEFNEKLIFNNLVWKLKD